MKKIFMIFGAVAVIFGTAGMYIGARQFGNPQPTVPASPVVANFLAQQLPDVNGRPSPLAQWKDMPLVVNFWATWCAPCVEEMPELVALQKEIGPKRVQIIGIGLDSASAITAFALKYKINYPLYVAGMTGTDLMRDFGNVNGGLPFTVLIDSKGNVVKTYLARLKMDALRADIAALK